MADLHGQRDARLILWCLVLSYPVVFAAGVVTCYFVGRN